MCTPSISVRPPSVSVPPFGYLRSFKSDLDAVRSKVGLLNKQIKTRNFVSPLSVCNHLLFVPQVSLTTSQELISNINYICQLTRSLIRFKQAIKEDEIIFTTTHLHYRAANFLHLVFLGACIHHLALLWVLVVGLGVHLQHLHGEL